MSFPPAGGVGRRATSLVNYLNARHGSNLSRGSVAEKFAEVVRKLRSLSFTSYPDRGKLLLRRIMWGLGVAVGGGFDPRGVSSRDNYICEFRRRCLHGISLYQGRKVLGI